MYADFQDILNWNTFGFASCSEFIDLKILQFCVHLRPFKAIS